MKTRTILVVDDDHDIVDSLSLFLRWEGWEVWTASSGVEALTVLAESGAPLVLLTDVMMPVMNGVELVEKIEGVPALDSTVVIQMSAHRPDKVSPRVHELIMKPFDMKALLLLLDGVVSGGRHAVSGTGDATHLARAQDYDPVQDGDALPERNRRAGPAPVRGR